MNVDEWVSTLAGVGVVVTSGQLKEYFKPLGIRPGGVTEDVLLDHADRIRECVAAPALVGDSSSVDTADLIRVVDEQSRQLCALGDELRPWIKQKATADAETIASVLTSYGPLVMGGIQERLAADPFGAQVASFRRQLSEQLAGVAADAPALPAPPEG